MTMPGEVDRIIGRQLKNLRWHWDTRYFIWHDSPAGLFMALSKLLPAGVELSAPTADGLREQIRDDYFRRTGQRET